MSTLVKEEYQTQQQAQPKQSILPYMRTVASSSMATVAVTIDPSLTESLNEGIIKSIYGFSSKQIEAAKPEQLSILVDALRPLRLAPQQSNASQLDQVTRTSNLNKRLQEPVRIDKITQDQVKDAVNKLIDLMRAYKGKPIKLKEINILDGDKQAFRQQVLSMTPMFTRIDKLMQIYLVLSSNRKLTMKLIAIKHIIQEQLKALGGIEALTSSRQPSRADSLQPLLPANGQERYLVQLSDLRKIQTTLTQYFLYVKNNTVISFDQGMATSM